MLSRKCSIREKLAAVSCNADGARLGGAGWGSGTTGKPGRAWHGCMGGARRGGCGGLGHIYCKPIGLPEINVNDTIILLQYLLLLSRNRFVQLLTSVFCWLAARRNSYGKTLAT